MYQSLFMEGKIWKSQGLVIDGKWKQFDESQGNKSHYAYIKDFSGFMYNKAKHKQKTNHKKFYLKIR